MYYPKLSVSVPQLTFKSTVHVRALSQKTYTYTHMH